GLELLFPLGDGRHVDAHGRPVDPAPDADRSVTQLLRGGQVVALLVHRRDLGDLVGEVGRAARLWLEHERLRAEVRGRVDALRAALSELRELASGIYPAVLTDEGIAAAIRVLGQSSRGPVTVESVTAERLPAAVEAAAYFLVADIVRRSGEAAVRVAATLEGD